VARRRPADYLTAGDAAGLLIRVGELSVAGSRLAFELEDLATDPMRARARQAPEMQEYARLWQGGLPEVRRWLADHGWQPAWRSRASVTAGYGRPRGVPSTGGFVVATRL
jgi:O-methyltransferase involved in polyketide biosynthesis